MTAAKGKVGVTKTNLLVAVRARKDALHKARMVATYMDIVAGGCTLSREEAGRLFAQAFHPGAPPDRLPAARAVAAKAQHAKAARLSRIELGGKIYAQLLGYAASREDSASID